MQVLSPQSTGGARQVVSALGGLVIAAALLATGAALGYVAFGTSFVTQFSLDPRPGPGQVAAAILGWTFAFTGPGVFFLIGIARIAAVVDRVGATRPRRSRVTRLAADLSDDYLAASRVVLPDGRRIPELVLGPFGIAVIEYLPPPSATRQLGGRWEVRLENGRWIPLENPLDRATRDAEAVRRWVADGDRDFVVKVYAAVVAPDDTLLRTATCAVLTADRVSAWLTSLAPQRSLTPTRRERLVELIRSGI